MSTAPHTPQTAQQNQNRRKKIRAVLASGLVLGVGAAVTLAAWSDTVWGEGTFGTEGSAFNIQGSFDGGNSWEEHVSSQGAGADGPGQMTFAQNANSLIPGVPAYQLIGLQETEGNLGADVVLTRTNSDTSVLSDLVTVRAADAGTSATAPTCGPGQSFGPGTTIGAAPSEMLTTEIAPGEYRWVCVSATLDADAPLAVSDVVSEPILWQFAATSQDPADD